MTQDDQTADRIAALEVTDVRFPTSRQRDGSDAMSPFPDYSAAYLRLRTEGGEIGYAFDPAFGGRGLATEAAAAMLRLGFEDLGLHRVIARLDARNLPSARLCERLGMRLEARLVRNEWFKGEWSDELDFAMLADEWPATPGHAIAHAPLP